MGVKIRACFQTTVLFSLLLCAGCADRAQPGAADTPTTQGAARAFVPSRHGFAFTNSFQGSPFPGSVRNSPLGALVRDHAGDVGLGVPSNFGFCGGMCAAAADFWLAGRAVPARTEPPDEGEALYDYLRERNAESLGVAGVMALKFIEWMGMPEVAEGRCTAALTAAELGPIVERVRARGFAHLGLVYVDSRTGRPWQNHQVLACAVETSTSSRVVFRLYEPNDPGEDHILLEFLLEKDAGGRELARVREHKRAKIVRVRGVFAMPYEPRVPPEGL